MLLYMCMFRIYTVRSTKQRSTIIILCIYITTIYRIECDLLAMELIRFGFWLILISIKTNFPSHCRIYTQLHRANKKQRKRKTRDVMLLRPDRKLDCSQFRVRSGEGVSVFLRDYIQCWRRIRYVPYTQHTECFVGCVTHASTEPVMLL